MCSFSNVLVFALLGKQSQSAIAWRLRKAPPSLHLTPMFSQAYLHTSAAAQGALPVAIPQNHGTLWCQLFQGVQGLLRFGILQFRPVREFSKRTTMTASAKVPLCAHVSQTAYTHRYICTQSWAKIEDESAQKEME